jgi:hypothetical protein
MNPTQLSFPIESHGIELHFLAAEYNTSESEVLWLFRAIRMHYYIERRSLLNKDQYVPMINTLLGEVVATSQSIRT